MNYLYILSFVSLLGWSFFLSLRYKKYAPYFPFLVATGLISILYVAGFFKILLIVSFVIFLLGFLLPMYSIFKLKVTWQEIKSLPFGFYFLLFSGLAWFVFTLKASIFGWDEFFWGQFTKAILHTDNFYTTESAILVGKINYPPGIALFQYFFLRFSRYNEAVLYFAQGILVLSSISFIFDLVGKHWKKLIVFTVATFSALLYFGPGLLSITNDHIIGVIFASAVLSSVYILRTGKSKLMLIPAIFCLPIIKITGIALSLTVVLIICLDLLIKNLSKIKNRLKLNNWKNMLGIIILMGLAAVVPMKSWDFYVKGQGIVDSSSIPSPSRINEAFSENATTREKTIIGNFKQAVVKMPMNQQDGGYKSEQRIIKFYLTFTEKINKPGLTIPIWLLIFTIPLGFIIYFGKKDDRSRILSLYISLVVGLSVFLFLHLLAYTFYFSEFEGVNLASMSRYINSYLLGMALITIGSLAVFMKENPKYEKVLGWISDIILLFLLIFHTPPFYQLIVPPQIMAKSTEVVREKTKPFSDDINARTEESSKVWLIYQNTNGWECMMVRYEIAPRIMNGGDGSWSLGEKYGSGDVWTNNASKENWSYRLTNEKFDYVYLAQADDNFWTHYGD